MYDITKNNKMEIIRKIYAESLDQIDLQNIGCHWTTDSEVLMKNGTFNDSKAIGLVFYIYATIEDDIIDKEATEWSNLAYPSEKEVVMLPNRTIDLIVWNQATGEDEIETIGSTGTKMDDWVKNRSFE